MARWLQSGVNPEYEELRRWSRESDGDTDSLFDDSVGGCQDFDLMVSLSMDEYEQLIVDNTPTVTMAARQFFVPLLIRVLLLGSESGHWSQYAGPDGAQRLALTAFMQRWRHLSPSEQQSSDGVELLKRVAAFLDEFLTAQPAEAPGVPALLTRYSKEWGGWV